MKNAFRELEVGNLNSAGMKIMHFERPKNAHCFRTHWQDRIEFLVLKKGKMTIEYNHKILILKAGQTAIIPPRTVHRGYTTDSSAIYDAVMFDLRFFYNETPICRQTLPQIFDGELTFNAITDNKQIFRCLNEICKSENAMQTVSFVYLLLFLVLENEVIKVNAFLNSGVKNIVKYIEEHYSEPLSTAVLSSVFNYSSEHFCRKFKEGTGLTPMKYLKIYRLENAYKMLKAGDRNIGAIAAKCGFDDANYFTRCFKKHFGHPPSRYV